MSFTNHETRAVAHRSLSDPASARSPFTHLPAIDGLRGIAIVLVLWYHGPYLFDHTNALSASLFWRMSVGGWIGVDLFFVISGFLITTILLRTRRSAGQLSIFYARRALRILPLAYLYLIVLAISGTLATSDDLLAGFDGWVWYACYLGNLHIAVHGYQPLPVMILWSLAVEEQFYFVWPIIVRFLHPKRLLSFCIIIMLLSPLIRTMVVYYPAVYVLTLCRGDGLAAGAMLAVLLGDDLYRDRTVRWCRRLVVPALLIIVLTLVGPFGPSHGVKNPIEFTAFGYTWLALAFAILVGAWSQPHGLVKAVLTNPVLRNAGKLCYGLYVWHCLCGVLIQSWASAWGWVGLNFYFKLSLWLASCVAVSSVSWFAFEQRFLKLKRLVPHTNALKSDSPLSEIVHPVPSENRVQAELQIS